MVSPWKKLNNRKNKIKIIYTMRLREEMVSSGKNKKIRIKKWNRMFRSKINSVIMKKNRMEKEVKLKIEILRCGMIKKI